MQEEYKEYYIKKLDIKRVKDLVYLFEVAFGNKPSENDITNKHLFCHGENKFVGFIAYHKITNEPAAFYGVYPIYIMYEGEKILACQSGDTMTHPNHQKKGLFVHLAKLTYAYCTSIGITLVFGFPNSNSYPGFIKHLQFTELAKLENITFLENKFEICRFSSKNKWLTNLHIQYIKLIFVIFSKKGHSFPNTNSKNKVALAYVVHDEIYFKLKDNSDKLFIKINGVNIWIKISGNSINIGDIDIDNQKLFLSVLKRLRLITRISGCRFLSTSLSNNSYLSSLLNEFRNQSIISRSKGYRPIFLNLSISIPFEYFSFLDSDIDVF